MFFKGGVGGGGRCKLVQKILDQQKKKQKKGEITKSLIFEMKVK